MLDTYRKGMLLDNNLLKIIINFSVYKVSLIFNVYLIFQADLQ